MTQDQTERQDEAEAEPASDPGFFVWAAITLAYGVVAFAMLQALELASGRVPLIAGY